MMNPTKHRPQSPVDIPQTPYPDPFMYYHEERYIKLLKEHPSLTKLAIGRLIAEEWQEMEEIEHQYYKKIQQIARKYYEHYNRYDDEEKTFFIKQGIPTQREKEASEDSSLSGYESDKRLRKVEFKSTNPKRRRGRISKNQRQSPIKKDNQQSNQGITQIFSQEPQQNQSYGGNKQSSGYMHDLGENTNQSSIKKSPQNQASRYKSQTSPKMNSKRNKMNKSSGRSSSSRRMESNQGEKQRSNSRKKQGRMQQGQKSQRSFNQNDKSNDDGENENVYRSMVDGRLHDRLTGKYAPQPSNSTTQVRSTSKQKRNSSNQQKMDNLQENDSNDDANNEDEEELQNQILDPGVKMDPDGNISKSKQRGMSDQEIEGKNQQMGANQFRQKDDQDQDGDNEFRSTSDGRLRDKMTGQFVPENQETNESSNQIKSKDKSDVQKRHVSNQEIQNHSGMRNQNQKQSVNQSKLYETQKEEDNAGGQVENEFRSASDGRLRDKMTGQFVPENQELNESSNRIKSKDNSYVQKKQVSDQEIQNHSEMKTQNHKQSVNQSKLYETQKQEGNEGEQLDNEFRSASDGRLRDKMTGQFVPENQELNESSNRFKSKDNSYIYKSKLQQSQKEEDNKGEQVENEFRSESDGRLRDKMTGQFVPESMGNTQDLSQNSGKRQQNPQDVSKENTIQSFQEVFRSQVDGRLHDQATGQFVSEQNDQKRTLNDKNNEKYDNQKTKKPSPSQKGQTLGEESNQSYKKQSLSKQDLKKQQDDEWTDMLSEKKKKSVQGEIEQIKNQKPDATSRQYGTQLDQSQTESQKQLTLPVTNKDKLQSGQVLDNEDYTRENTLQASQIRQNLISSKQPKQSGKISAKQIGQQGSQMLSPIESVTSSEQSKKLKLKENKGINIRLEYSVENQKHLQSYQVAKEAIQKAFSSTKVEYNLINGSTKMFSVYLVQEKIYPIWGSQDPTLTDKNSSELIDRLMKLQSIN